MKRVVLLLLLAARAAGAAPTGGSVIGSRHDLSTSGPGPIRALAEANACVFCHIPHGAGTPEGLSSRPELTAKHRPYESSTMTARPGAPTGASRLCLSCHDGTIAVGKTLAKEIRMTVPTIPADRRSNLGTDLRKTHPISFRPEPGSRTRKPSKKDAVRLDAAGEIQCTSCHDPHQEYIDPVRGKFLVKPNRRSALCLPCHDAGAVEGPASSHASSPARFGPAEGNEGAFDSVGDAGCAACHVSHGAEPSGRLVRKPPADDDAACLRCHASPVTRLHIGNEISKPYAHGGQGRGVHDAAEGRSGKRPLPERAPGTPRHVACVDCHEPHLATGERPLAAPAASGALAGVWGIDLYGNRVEPVQFEYEVCLKCHGDSGNKPQANGLASSDGVRRRAPGANLRSVFSPSSPSFHPVAVPGKNPDVPSLKAGYSTSSLIYCTDCHASNTGPGAGGVGPRGPHGSTYPHLLERSYSAADFTAESPSAYALCYKCHDRDKLLSDRDDAFRRLLPGGGQLSLHRRHVRENLAPCSACHDAHGVSSEGGSPAENAHLVDFDTSIVRATPGAPLGYRTFGPRSGSCNLTCHGETHTEQTHAY